MLQIEHFAGDAADTAALGRPKHGVASLICMRAKGAAVASPHPGRPQSRLAAVLVVVVVLCVTFVCLDGTPGDKYKC